MCESHAERGRERCRRACASPHARERGMGEANARGHLKAAPPHARKSARINDALQNWAIFPHRRQGAAQSAQRVRQDRAGGAFPPKAQVRFVSLPSHFLKKAELRVLSHGAFIGDARVDEPPYDTSRAPWKGASASPRGASGAADYARAGVRERAAPPLLSAPERPRATVFRYHGGSPPLWAAARARRKGKARGARSSE